MSSGSVWNRTVSGTSVPSCWGLCWRCISVLQAGWQSVWLLVATDLDCLKNISCPKHTRSGWIWAQGVAGIIQGLPRSFLSRKKRDVFKIMDPFPGFALFIPPEERARKRDRCLRNTLIWNVINIAFLCERNWAENDLLSSSQILLHVYFFVHQR